MSLGIKKIFLAVVFLSLVIGHIVSAQDTEPKPGTIFICVDPNTVPDSTDAYLIGFATTHLLGFIPSEPEGASVTIYSSPQTPVLAVVYHIQPDALTGGYRRTEKVGVAFTTANLKANRPCSIKDEKVVLPDTLEMTMPLPVSPNQAILMKVNDTETISIADSTLAEQSLDNTDILGNAALRFISKTNSIEKSFQFIQLNTDQIDLFFPFITENTDFVMLSNKSITLSLSTLDAPDDFVLGRGSFSYQRLNKRLTDNFQQTLFHLMTVGNFHIYPNEGVLEIYEVGGMVRVEMGDTIARRNPTFVANSEGIEGQTVRPLQLPGMVVEYTLIGEIAAVRKLTTDTDGNAEGNFRELRVIRVDENGNLIVTQLDSDDEAIVQAWLVEVVTPPP